MNEEESIIVGNMGSASSHNMMMKGNLQHDIGVLNDVGMNLMVKSILRKVRKKTVEKGSIHDYDQAR